MESSESTFTTGLVASPTKMILPSSLSGRIERAGSHWMAHCLGLQAIGP